MFARTWQLGIDIQPRTLCAVAITFHRKGWQLKRWWQFSSPINVVESGRLRQSDWLNHLLSELRSQLPSNTSVRIGLSPEIIMQQSISMPDADVPPSLQQNLLDLAAEKSLLLPRSEFACDYSRQPSSSKDWLMTAVRQQDMQDWMTPLANAGLAPSIADITPCTMRRSAALSRQSPTALLLHVGESVLTWAAPFSQSLAFGYIPREVGEEHSSVAERVTSHAAQYDVPAHSMLCCGAVQSSGWSPFSALTFLQPPLPAQPEMFALAIGLALCAERTSWSR